MSGALDPTFTVVVLFSCIKKNLERTWTIWCNSSILDLTYNNRESTLMSEHNLIAICSAGRSERRTYQSRFPISAGSMCLFVGVEGRSCSWFILVTWASWLQVGSRKLITKNWWPYVRPPTLWHSLSSSSLAKFAPFIDDSASFSEW